MKQFKLRPPLPESHKHLKRMSDSFNFQCKMTNLTTSNDINKSTKCLVLNSKRYDKYLFNYKLFTQKKTFMVPNVMSYPIYKNTEIIPINMNGYATMHSYSTSITEASNEKKVRLSLKEDYTMFTGVGVKKDRRKYYSPNNSSLKEKNEIVFLSDILFYDEKYEGMIYNEKEIFYNKNEFYFNIIRDRIEKIKKKQYTNVNNLYKKYYSEKKSIDMKMTSLNLSFESLTDTSKKNKEITLPFDYLPLFYYKDFDFFKFILIALVKINNKEISLDIEAMIDFITTTKMFKENVKTDNKKGNVYIFIWNTPHYVYKVTMALPMIHVFFNEFDTQIVIKAHSKLMLYLISCNLFNWDFYTIRYLFSFKKFRELIKVSMMNNTHKFSHEIFNVLSDSIVDYIDSKNINKKYMYINTDDKGCNSINVIRSYSMIYYSDKGKNFNFSFNLNQMKILCYVSKFESLPSFLLKLIDTSNSEITLNYNYVNTLNKDTFIVELLNDKGIQSIYRNSSLYK